MKQIGFIGKPDMFADFKESADMLGLNIVHVDLHSNVPYIKNMTHCIVRSTNTIKEQIREFVLLNPHIDFIDNKTRFFDDLGKVVTSKIRENDGTGAKNYTMQQIKDLTPFPIVAKPINGRFCRGINYIHNSHEFDNFINSCEDIRDYFFQEMMPIVDEFRVLRISIGGCVETFITRRKTVRGKKNVNIRNRKPLPSGKIKAFLDKHRYYKIGIVGYDIGRLPNGDFKIIEENRTPRYDRTERRLKSRMQDDIPTTILKMIMLS